ncbi:MAG: hypothetical protein LBT00_02540 [Spirochaetaceae bacterium]|nr:hypothetical protein [Spirochaetaceae bacterium]
MPPPRHADEPDVIASEPPVIASEARQSRGHAPRLDCFAASRFAMTTDPTSLRAGRSKSGAKQSSVKASPVWIASPLRASPCRRTRRHCERAPRHYERSEAIQCECLPRLDCFAANGPVAAASPCRRTRHHYEQVPPSLRAERSNPR